MILLYHKVHPEAKTTWWVTPDAFYLQMLDLQDRTVVRLDDYDPSDPTQVVVSFDGVYENVWTYAVPILKHFGYPFELFVIGSSIGQGNEFDGGEPFARFADGPTLGKMVAAGGRLQWHTWSHPVLLAPQNDDVYRRELEVPPELKALDPEGFRWFAYPHGQRDEALKAQARRYFRGSLACDDGIPGDIWDLPRLTVRDHSRFTKSTVSLIIPCYNYGHFAAEAIESALRQTCPPDEILFIDDASTDNSLEVARRYESQVRIVANSENLGVVENFRKAVSLTSGDYICFLGADNRFRSDYVEKSKSLLDRHQDVGVAYTNFTLFGPTATAEALRTGASPHPYAQGFFEKRFPAHPTHKIEDGNYVHGSSMFRRTAYDQAGGYRSENLPEDQSLFARMLAAGWKAELVDHSLLEYRQHSNDQVNQLKSLELTNAYLNSRINTLTEEVKSLTSQLNLERQRLWRPGAWLQRLRSVFLKPGSRAEAAVRLVYRGMRLLRREGPKRFLRGVLARTSRALASTDYRVWIRRNEPDTEALRRQRLEAAKLDHRPLISIVMPVYAPPAAVLRAAMESVLAQTYDNWELCIANSSPPDRDTRALLDGFAQQDKRIKVVHLERNAGIAANTNAAIRLAAGEFVGFLDHDDTLAPFALFEVVRIVMEQPAVDFIYSDEDKITADGTRRYDPHFKPGFNLHFLEAVNYMPHFLVLRRKLGEELGWLRTGFEGSQDYDLVLRAAERAKLIAHSPRILYHWRAVEGSTALSSEAKVGSSQAGIRALQDHFRRLGMPASVTPGPFPTTYRTTTGVPSGALVSIIIPNMDHAADLRRCVESILARSSYKRIEIIILENNSQDPATWSLYRELETHGHVSMVQFDEKPFNFSSANNHAAEQARGEFLLFLNNDVEVITPDWIERMLQYFMRPQVGVVGAKLLYPNGSIQHAGVIVGVGGVAGHSHKLFPADSPGYFFRAALPQDLSAVTGACLLIRKQVFDQVGGFDPAYRLAFGDVDLCMKVRQRGYSVVWTPYAQLYHHESTSRGREDTREKVRRFRTEMATFRERWSDFLARGDEFYNPNLTLIREDFGVGHPSIKPSVRLSPGLRGLEPLSVPTEEQAA